MKVRSSPPYLPDSKLVASAFLEPMGPSHQSPLQPQHETALDTTTSESQRQPILDISQMSLHNYRCTRRRLNRSVTCPRPIVEELCNALPTAVGRHDAQALTAQSCSTRLHTTCTYILYYDSTVVDSSDRIANETRLFVSFFRYGRLGRSPQSRLHQRFASVFGVCVASPRGYSAALIPVARFEDETLTVSTLHRRMRSGTSTRLQGQTKLFGYPCLHTPSREFGEGKLASQPRYQAASLLSR